MSPKPDEYQVEGYGVRTEGYDAPYHPAADFDPSVDLEFAGAPEEAAKAQRKRKGKKPSEFDSPRGEEIKTAKLTTPVPPKATAENVKGEASKTDSKTDSKAESKQTPAKKSTAKKTTAKTAKTAKKAVKRATSPNKK